MVPAPAKPELHYEIIRVSIELGSELGEEGLTMRAIAARLGVSATALYQHFESKAAILREIRLQGVRQLTARQVEHRHLGPIERLHALAKTYVDFALEHVWLYRVLFVDEAVDWSSVESTAREELLAPLVELQNAFRVGVDAGVFRKDMDVSSSALLLWASGHGLASLLITGRISEQHPAYPVPDRDAFVRGFIESLVRSVAA